MKRGEATTSLGRWLLARFAILSYQVGGQLVIFPTSQLNVESAPVGRSQKHGKTDLGLCRANGLPSILTGLCRFRASSRNRGALTLIGARLTLKWLAAQPVIVKASCTGLQTIATGNLA